MMNGKYWVSATEEAFDAHLDGDICRSRSQKVDGINTQTLKLLII